ncbi:AlpA family phage regulatory protein [Pantoea stewartii]|uniref:helix-turn-helix transcriptional regulator n=1 Tax=Pantoea stewartii TaxID=66269 RepID=UPI0013DDFD2E|nr:AlpA family phage regulatory protein [Pantoea stewartii]QIE97533.1 AlpA family phage regulatory protein [Pantoea stewartii]
MELLTTKQVCAITTLSRMTIWRYEQAGLFPSRIQLGIQRVAWRKADVENWLASRHQITPAK